jgi:tetratricopeptide (TPR) repeat protein
MTDNVCYVPVSIGELIDKFTILQIKQTKIQNAEKLAMVEKEITYLQPFVDKHNLEPEIIDELREINEKLWVVEDQIRDKEKIRVFDDEFIQLARSVYIINDKRCETKNKINTILNSGLSEVKSYTKYKDDNDSEIIKLGETKQIISQTVKPPKETVEELYKKIKKSEGDYNTAIQYYKKILELNPMNINKYLRELGEIYEKQNMFYEAVECYVKVLKTETIDVNTIGVLTNQIGSCYFNLTQYKLAIHYFKKVLLIKEIPDVYSNIGLCNVKLKDYKEAEINLLKSYNLKNNNHLACHTLGDVYYFTKKYDKSIKYYKKITNPNSTQTYNLSFPYLAKKDFKNGFKLYEDRLKINNINPQTNVNERLDVPLEYWDGDTKCNSLLLLAEQGLGDNIQYYRFIIELSEKYPTMKITYFTKKEIAHLFKTYNNIEIIQNLYIFNFEYKLYIMSLPKILNLTQIVPNKINYINIDEEKLAFWKNKMDSLHLCTSKTPTKSADLSDKGNSYHALEKCEGVKRYKVGFVYNGLLSSFIDKNIPLAEFEKLCDLNIDLICIHRKSEVEKDFSKISFLDKIIHYDIDNDKPFEDTIHLLQNLDLLITIDTFIVHLAGILNVKTWLLLGASEWRWSDDASKTYWYNSVELIRTKENEELKDLIKTVKTKLAREL